MNQNLKNKLNSRKDIINWQFVLYNSQTVKAGYINSELSAYRAPQFLEIFIGLITVQWDNKKISSFKINPSSIEMFDYICDTSKISAIDDIFYEIKYPTKLPEIKVFDNNVKDLVDNPGRLVDELNQITLPTIKMDTSVSINSNYSASTTKKTIANKNFEYAYQESLYSFSASFNRFHSFDITQRNYKNKNEVIEKFNQEYEINKVLKNVFDIPREKIKIIFSPALTNLIMIKYLAENLNIENIVQNRAYFNIDNKNKKMLNDSFNLIIDPTVDFGSGSYIIGDNGVVAFRQQLIKDGFIQDFICNKASKDYDFKPTVQIYNNDSLFINSDNYKDLGDIDSAYYISSVLGLKTNESSTGDFSLRLSEVLVVKNGNFTGTLAGGVINGNIFDIINNNSTSYINVPNEKKLALCYEGNIS